MPPSCAGQAETPGARKWVMLRLRPAAREGQVPAMPPKNPAGPVPPAPRSAPAWGAESNAGPRTAQSAAGSWPRGDPALLCLLGRLSSGNRSGRGRTSWPRRRRIREFRRRTTSWMSSLAVALWPAAMVVEMLITTTKNPNDTTTTPELNGLAGVPRCGELVGEGSAEREGCGRHLGGQCSGRPAGLCLHACLHGVLRLGRVIPVRPSGGAIRRVRWP
jgi:hypothetical protein